MLQEMRLRGVFGDFVVLLTLGRSLPADKAGEKFLRSFGKQWEAKLPTYPLIINKNTQNCAEIKNCAVGEKSRSELFGIWCSVSVNNNIGEWHRSRAATPHSPS
ncbi:MAG: hypothetical protein JNM41_09100 [Flavipsychrobacter sp.]|nr:hypothetical protein [Flavipsychrobacter sp.]